LVLSKYCSWPCPDSPDSPQEILLKNFIQLLGTGGLKIRALLKDGVAYSALSNDLFLFENQIPMDLLKNVISKCYLLPKGQNSYSDTFQELNNPQSSLRKKFLHKILSDVVCQMCTEIFVKPCSDQETLSNLIDANYPVGGLEDCAHIFACVYKILTTFPIKQESPTTTKSHPDEDKTKGVHICSFVYKILTIFHIKKESSTATISLLNENKTKESASDREQLPHATSFGNSPTVLDIRKTSPIDLEQPGDCELQMSRIPEAEFNAVGGRAIRHLMPAIQNEPGGNLEKGPETVAIEDLPGRRRVGATMASRICSRPEPVATEHLPGGVYLTFQQSRSNFVVPKPGRQRKKAWPKKH
jgi:hypothetical protein